MNRNKRRLKEYKHYSRNLQRDSSKMLNAKQFLDLVFKPELWKGLIPSIHVKNINNFIYDSGKLDLLYNLMMRLRKEKRKVLIFTQMTKMLNLLERFLAAKGFSYVRLDGSVPAEKRQIIVQTFNKNPKIMVFISSTRVGGIGINLTAADTVIFYDNDWNPAVDKQAQDRCHRIGQCRDVTVYRMVTEHTIEENILMTSDLKAKMDDLVLNKGQFNLLKLFQSRGFGKKSKNKKGEVENELMMEEGSRRLAKYLDLVEDAEDRLETSNKSEESSFMGSDNEGLSDRSRDDFEDIEDGGSGNLHNRIIDDMIPPIWKFGASYLENIYKKEVKPSLKKNQQNKKLKEEPKKLEILSKADSVNKQDTPSNFLSENEKYKIEMDEKRYKDILSRINFDLSQEESKILIQQLRSTLD
jgi:superfamily II DNA/RNA helicase